MTMPLQPAIEAAGATRCSWALAWTLGSWLLAGSALAQAPYKVVTPDGRITYTDRPVVAAPGVQIEPLRRDALAAPVVGPALPVELQAVATRFPVTLYTSNDCAPCDKGRQLLQQRGIPYSERSITNDDDVAAMQRLTGGSNVPSLTVGSQALRGFLGSDWQATLDLAGYPKESRLPRNWQPPPPAPLVARSMPAPAARADRDTSSGEPAFPTASPDGPGGIRF